MDRTRHHTTHKEEDEDEEDDDEEEEAINAQQATRRQHGVNNTTKTTTQQLNNAGRLAIISRVALTSHGSVIDGFVVSVKTRVDSWISSSLCVTMLARREGTLPHNSPRSLQIIKGNSVFDFLSALCASWCSVLSSSETLFLCGWPVQCVPM